MLCIYILWVSLEDGPYNYLLVHAGIDPVNFWIDSRWGWWVNVFVEALSTIPREHLPGLRDTRYKISCRSLDRFWVGSVGECFRRSFIPNYILPTSHLPNSTPHLPYQNKCRIMWCVGVAYSLHELHALRSDPSLIRWYLYFHLSSYFDSRIFCAQLCPRTYLLL
jgi:hypothetical protein